MLKNINLENFKSFKNLTNFELSPITIICGTNSCGKSSILQSIMAMKQTIESQANNQIFLLNGKYVHLGIFQNVIYEKKSSNEISINSTHDFKNNSDHMTRHYLRSISRYHPNDDADLNNVTFEFKVKLKLLVKRVKKISIKPIKVSKYSINFSFPSKTDNNLTYSSSILFELNTGNNYNIYWENIKIENENDSLSQGSTRAECEFINLIPSIKRVINGHENNITDLFMFFWRYKQLMLDTYSKYSYIGPLREEASRRYIYEDEISEIGIKGENSAYLYMNEAQNEIKKFFYFNKNKNEFLSKKSTLKDGVNEWLDFLGISGFNSKIDHDIIRLNLNANKEREDIEINIADVGFGISQVFPIILEGLRIEPYETLILEQPEIHLHPKMQMDIADYFISLGLAKKNLLIETHSEHMINRLVRRIIEDDTNKLSEMISIYFISSTENGAEIEKVNINPESGIVNWPEGFFDQSVAEEEKILLAGLNRRRNKRINNGNI